MADSIEAPAAALEFHEDIDVVVAELLSLKAASCFVVSSLVH